MNYQVFLTYIILALVIALLIQILFNTFYPCHEPQKAYNLKNIYPGKNQDSIPEEASNPENNGNNDSLIDNALPNNLMDDYESIIPEDRSSGLSGYTDWEQDSYERVSENDNNLKEYRNKFMDFRSHVWKRSDEGQDVVDRVNQTLIDGAAEPECEPEEPEPSGKKISDIYDSLTNNKTDSVMNGGLFYDEVTGMDPSQNVEMPF